MSTNEARRRALARALTTALVLCVAWLSLPRPGNADAPAGRYEVTAGTAKDTKTGLVWQIAHSAPMVRADAAAYCQSLTTNGTGWRVPSGRELLSLTDLSGGPIAIDAKTFPTATAERYWTTNEIPSDQFGRVHVVDFRDGSLVLGSKNATGRVRCVR